MNSDDRNSQFHRALHFVLESVEKRYKMMAAFVAIAMVSIIFAHFFYFPVYEAKSVVRVQTEQKVSIPVLLATQQGFGGYGTESREMTRYLRYLESEPFLLTVAQNLKFSAQSASLDLSDPKKVSCFSGEFWKRYFNPSVPREKSFKMMDLHSEELIGKMAPLVKTESDGMELITITVNSLDPKTSMLIANAYADAFAHLSQQKDTEELVEVEKYVHEKLAEITDRMKLSERKMIKLQESNHLTATEGNGTVMSSHLKDIETKVSELSVQQSENERILNYYHSANPEERGDVNGKEIRDFRISELTRKNKEIDDQKGSLLQLAEKAEEKFSSLPKAEQEYFRLKRQEQLDYELYSSLVQKLSQIEIQKFSIFKKISIDSAAREGSPSARVNFVLKLLFGIVSSLFFAGVLSLVMEWLDPTLKNGEDLADARIEQIGIIPKIEKNKSITSVFGKRQPKNSKTRPASEMLVTRSNPKSLESMSFKYVRARLQKIMEADGHRSKTILVTSAASDDGKSFVACNLAISFAQLGKKTLLMDCDFRNPSVNRYFGLPNRKGLASVLAMEHTLEELITEDPQVPTLHILPADWGVEDPTELLSDEKMLVLLEHLKTIYDYVIIDSPPVQLVVDGLILSSVVSTVVVVGRYRKTLKSALFKTYHDLVNVSFQKVYGVLNDAEQSRILQFFGHSMGGYGYHNGANKYYPEGRSDSESEGQKSAKHTPPRRTG
ncbi:MAG: polysaccharide biosynthesis tyrosine autokinase [Bdellovibrionales bacterium]|nr:polysaccharide biosynthesis tyrosine autokinase [Oligoflexia bacterium]